MDEDFENFIAEMVHLTEKSAKEYEDAIKKGNFEIPCPYQDIINDYENLRKEIVEKYGWNEQTATCTRSIKKYREKLEKDSKLREVEAIKAQKQKDYEQMYKIDEANLMEAVLDSLDTEERVLNFEEKKQEQKDEADIILETINKAEDMAKKYEKSIKWGKILEIDCPYEEVIESYKNAKKRFQDIGWNVEASNLINSIRFYQQKLEKDKKLREIEKKRLGR